ncbi:MAG TPA: phosphatase PAP2 family protein [Gemmatimonadales bacterium]|nr:phosphatase PAP2 family protein [Gemmatimonadales bacterium]
MPSRAHPPEPPALEPGSSPFIGAALGLGLMASAVALSVFVWLGYQIRIGEPPAFDLTVRHVLRSLETPALSNVMWAASVFAAPVRLLPLSLVVAAVFLLRGWRRGALLVLVTLTGAAVLDLGLKTLFARARPQAFFDYYPAPSSFSFPSGHALVATCLFGGIAVLITHRLESRAAQALVWLAAVAVILLVGVSRVYLGVHHPTDVIGGFAVGVVWVTAVALGDRLAEYRRNG